MIFILKTEHLKLKLLVKLIIRSIEIDYTFQVCAILRCYGQLFPFSVVHDFFTCASFLNYHEKYSLPYGKDTVVAAQCTVEIRSQHSHPELFTVSVCFHLFSSET